MLSLAVLIFGSAMAGIVAMVFMCGIRKHYKNPMTRGFKIELFFYGAIGSIGFFHMVLWLDRLKESLK